MVKIGLISYSLYLWHVPIFTFFYLIKIFDSHQYKVFAIILTFVLSAISFYLFKSDQVAVQKNPEMKDLVFSRDTKEPLVLDSKKIYLIGDSMAGHFHPTIFTYAEKK